MVDIAECIEGEEIILPPSQERLLDAEEIEKVAASLQRVSARVHLEALAKKLRKESDALRRMENSSPDPSKAGGEPTSVKGDSVMNVPASTAAPSVVPQGRTEPAVAPKTGKFTPIDRFSFDFGEYNSAFVTLYISLPGVGSIPKEQVSCEFTKDSFDLIVQDLNGESYRLFKDHLEKNIDVKKSKFIVKADKVVVKLAKIKGEYGSYDYWSKLTDSKKSSKASKTDNPQSSIMQLMRDMYEEGDDNMKKIIGETMMKQQRGELGKDGLGSGFGDSKLNEDF